MANEKMIFGTPGEYTIVTREGQAPQIKVYTPQLVKESGVITAPHDFYAVRKTMLGFDGGAFFPKAFTHVRVSREAGEIALIWGKNEEQQSRVTGRVELAENYKALNLNNEKQTVSPKELAALLKRYRYLFTDATEAMKVIADLQTFKADIKTNIVSEQDGRGNKKNLVETSIESNVPITFGMRIQLFKGFEKQKVTVNICFEQTGANTIECWLESIQALEWFEEQKDAIFESQLATFYADNIAVIEL